MTEQEIEQMYADKERFILALLPVFKSEPRSGLENLEYKRNYEYSMHSSIPKKLYEEAIIISYIGGGKRVIGVCGNSNLANAEAIIKELLR